MPRKICFNAVSATSEDPKYRLIELNSHGPTVKGWQSGKNCEYPQEIILQLERKCVLEKIQILAHQFMIPSKMEFYSSNHLSTDPKTIKWEYIGYVTLSNNESTEFKSRELKYANVPKTEASMIKLNLCENHKNNLNAYNQVSIIAINIIGSNLQAEPDPPSVTDGQLSKLNDIINNPEYISPYDDLAFEMYVAPDIQKIIRDMEIKKYLAVISERFEYARKLKHAMLRLKTAGEKLGKYELEKKHAIEKEDYEKASSKKAQLEQFRAEVFEELGIEDLLEVNGICPKNDESVDTSSAAENKNLLSPTMVRFDRRSSSPNQHQLNSASPLRHPSPKTGSPCTGSPIMSRGSLRRRNKSAGAIAKSTYEMYEEKPLPALRHSQTNEFLRECQVDPEHKTSSKLTEREKKQASLPILVFGCDIVEKFYSKHYLDKEEGLNKLKEELISYDNTKMHTANKTARAAVFLLHRALRDKVFTVYNLANEVIRLFFVQFVPGRVLPAEVSRSVDKLLPELLTKSGDTSARIHHMAVHTILTMADVKAVRDLHIIPVHLSRQVSSSTHPRLALSRAEMVEQLILNHGISTDKQSGLTCRTLSEFGASGLHHPAEAVRKVSERILVLVYKVNPRMVRKQLPPDDDITRRNLLYRQLFHEFDTIDMQRKRELLERNRVIQQYPAVNGECFSPEPKEPKNEISKCISTGNIEHIANNFSNNDNGKQNFSISKSQSGSNIGPTNGDKRHDTGSRSASGVSSPSNNSQKTDSERHCIFCNQSEKVILLMCNSMNSHYWRYCPMLVRCKHCSQVVEVATLTEHLLMECEKNDLFMQCSQCTEAVRKEDNQSHLLECNDVPEGYTRCPLCHKNLESTELCWKNHFMGTSNLCQKNTRVKNVKQVKIQV
ncbi:centrosomal protein of 104 kDa isoform X2 [Anthonomus grandis grandis]|uniref:centrosomal protein of 104 kDa isoform X2 n=1 Tax=Anthonomus grandis grandis TaxID=2921223 RepID=UPI00216692A7|nr:centrosomal protein of 104 kDa isoform X2 [Anthonomus grandis grandis]